MDMSFSKSKLSFLSILILLATIVIFVAVTPVPQPKTEQPVACTQEAKVCPDGSAVGRTGPKCEFAPCPAAKTPTDDNSMKAYTYMNAKQAIAYGYPRTLPTKYISVAEWPPKVWVGMNQQFSCATTSTTSNPAFENSQLKTIGGRVYCINNLNDGAAGSIYSHYSYFTEQDGNFVSVQFTLREVQCDNYDDPQKTECKTERAAFDPDAVATGVMSSFQLTEPVVILDKLVPGNEVYSPLTITGQAKGSWFFEGSFPMQLRDSNGQVIGTAVTKATKEWMTDTMVPFTATLTFDASQTDPGELVFKRDNPSGMPQNDAEVRLGVLIQGPSK